MATEIGSYLPKQIGINCDPLASCVLTLILGTSNALLVMLPNLIAVERFLE